MRTSLGIGRSKKVYKQGGENLNPDLLELHANEFRQALLAVPQNEFCMDTSLWFEAFPNGCCEDASLLLGAFFVGRGLSEVCRVFGSKHLGPNEVSSHVWLEVDGFIVDITADQDLFSEFDNPPVMVCRESAFHDTFEKVVGCKGSGDFRVYFESVPETLSKFWLNYTRVIQGLNLG